MLKKLLFHVLLVLIGMIYLAGSAERQGIFAAPMATSIFINEIHYDNAGTDSGEAIEIAGPTGTNLSGWSLVLYNGANGQMYDTDAVSGIIPDQCGGFGTLTINYPTDGLQNGAPDGIALVDNTSAVIQFLSYEGAFTATNGPANGLTSTDIGVSETATTPVGYSLQLAGTGTDYEDFFWVSASAHTFGTCNTDQTFFSGPKVLSTTPMDGETGIATDTQITITFNENVTLTPPWYTFSCTTSGNHTAAESGGPQTFHLDPDIDLSPIETCTITVFKDQVADLDGPPNSMLADYTFTFSTGRWVINEIHADPDAVEGDANKDGFVNVIEDEFVEIVNNTGAPVNIAGWTLSDFVGVKHTFPAGTIIPAICAILIFAGGAPTGTFGNAMVATASSGSLGLNNGGDTVTLRNGASTLATYTYGSEGGFNVSLTRDPDLTGPEPLVAHNTASGSGGARFSPGAKIDGTPFSDCVMPIHAIQGVNSTTSQTGNRVHISGIVVGDFQNTTTGLSGFYVQEEDEDADTNPATSEGIFVHDNGFGMDVSVGDLVKVTGTVTEYTSTDGGSNSSSLTQISNVTAITILNSGQPLPSPAVITLPIGNLTTWERYEGMRVIFSQTLYVTEHFQLGRFGQVTLSSGDRLSQPTHIAAPGAPALAIQAANDLNRIILDDTSVIHNPDPILHPQPGGLTADNTLRGGTTVTGLAGVLDHRFGFYRVQPTEAVNFTPANPRISLPANPGGSFKIVGFNVLNYFTTLDTGALICGPLSNLACRGANTSLELSRQRDKLLAALLTLNADIIGLIEIENHASDTALDDLVSRLNAIAGAGAYAQINTGPIGADAIKVALIYKPASAIPVGTFAILDNTFHPNFHDALNRPSLAQTFSQIPTGETFTVVVNHFKSKALACAGDPDTDDGQGNCNGTRTDAAHVLTSWLATDPTGSGDPDFLIIGDLNSYAREDPITALTAGGYINLIDTFLGTGAYSYAFDGQWGYLDYALANTALLSQIAGVTEWHINADEPLALDYNTEFKSPAQVLSLYNADAYRASDHDPVVVGLYSFDFSDLASTYGIAWHTGGGTLRLGTTWSDTPSYGNADDDSTDDGVIRFGTWVAGNPASVNATTNGAGYLAAWFDWDGSGTFEAGEKAIGQTIPGSGTHTINFTVDPTFDPALTLQTRFRFYESEPILFSPTGIEIPTGAGTGGEVEDYNWNFTPTALTLQTFSAQSVGLGLPLGVALLVILGLVGVTLKKKK